MIWTWLLRSRTPSPCCTMGRSSKRAASTRSVPVPASATSIWALVDGVGASATMAILEVQDIHTYYGDSYVLQGLSLTLGQGQILGVLGRNGVGKTTLVNSICGFVPPRRGKIVFKGGDITHIPSFETVRSGIGLVPQGRRVFPT